MPKDFTQEKLVSADLTFAKGILLLDQCEITEPWTVAGTGLTEAGTWDVSQAVYVKKFSVSAKETSPVGVFFKPDGLKMYIVGESGITVDEYDLSIAWDISTATYLQEFSIAAKEQYPTGFFIRPDGKKLYTIGGTADTINEYDLVTSWDISTSVFVQGLSVAAKESGPSGVFFVPDGLKMYTIGYGGVTVDEYNLSQAWNISTAVYLREFSVSAKETEPRGIFFKPDGLKMYTSGSVGNTVDEYNLSTAWNVSTAVYLQEFSIAAQEINPRGIFFKPDGSRMFAIGQTGDSVIEYFLGTASTKDYDLTAEAGAAYFGSLGFKLVTKLSEPAYADQVTATRLVPFPETDLLVYRFNFCLLDASETLAFWVRADFNDGSRAYAAALKYLPNGIKLQYLDENGAYQTILGYGQTACDESWIQIELVVQLKTHKYVSCTFNGIKTMLDTKSIYDEAAITDIYHSFQIGQMANGANQSIINIDSIYIGEFLNI